MLFGLGRFHENGWHRRTPSNSILFTSKTWFPKRAVSYFSIRVVGPFERIPPTQIAQIVRQNEGCPQCFQHHHLLFNLTIIFEGELVFRIVVSKMLAILPRINEITYHLHMVWYSEQWVWGFFRRGFPSQPLTDLQWGVGLLRGHPLCYPRVLHIFTLMSSRGEKSQRLDPILGGKPRKKGSIRWCFKGKHIWARWNYANMCKLDISYIIGPRRTSPHISGEIQFGRIISDCSELGYSAVFCWPLAANNKAESIWNECYIICTVLSYQFSKGFLRSFKALSQLFMQIPWKSLYFCPLSGAHLSKRLSPSKRICISGSRSMIASLRSTRDRWVIAAQCGWNQESRHGDAWTAWTQNVFSHFQ